MNACEELYAAVMSGGDHSPARSEQASARIDAYRAQVLAEAAAELDRIAERESPAPDFFQPDHTYTRRDGTTFQCVAVTTHPSSGERLALGWHTDTADWTFLAHQNLGQWLHEYDGGKAPADDTEAGEAR